MNKCTLLFGVLLLYIGIGCDLYIPGSTGFEQPEMSFIHIRNMSTASGVTLTLEPHNISWQDVSYWLAPSPQPGIPVDTSGRVVKNATYDWWVERAVDSVMIDSGTVKFDCEKWLLIEEDNGDWTCTWSDTEWE